MIPKIEELTELVGNSYEEHRERIIKRVSKELVEAAWEGKGFAVVSNLGVFRGEVARLLRDGGYRVENEWGSGEYIVSGWKLN